MESKRVFFHCSSVCIKFGFIEEFPHRNFHVGFLPASFFWTQEEFDEDEEFRLELRKQARTLLDGF